MVIRQGSSATAVTTTTAPAMVVSSKCRQPIRISSYKNYRLQQRLLFIAACCSTMIGLKTTEAYSLLRPPTKVSAFIPRQLSIQPRDNTHSCRATRSTKLSMVYAPPGSGYATPEDEKSKLPDTYDPMMEYPGTMRPGRTPENIAYHDLPNLDDPSEPIPWPHFQQIEWHHRWDHPPHPPPTTIEDYIEERGLWATPEFEAMIRAGRRQNVLERQEEEEQEKQDNLIIDDDEEDDADTGIARELGDGFSGNLGSSDDQALTAKITSSDDEDYDDDEEEEDDDEDDADLDEFLLDLGLDLDKDEDTESDDDDDDAPVATIPPPKKKRKGTVSIETGDVTYDAGEEITDDDDVDDDVDTIDNIEVFEEEDDDDMDMALDDDDGMKEFGGSGEDGVLTVPLDDYGNDDTFSSQEFFDDGGFDYDGDEGGGGGGGDGW